MHLDNIHFTQSEINALSLKIEQLKTTGGIGKYLKLSHLEKQFKKLDDKQFYNVDEYLVATDLSYKAIVDHNIELLKTDKLHFSVYTSSIAFLGSYTKEIIGSVFPNGFSYSYSTKSNIAFFPFDSLRFPTRMSGRIDHWGRFKLKTTDTSYALFKTLPKKLSGSVDAAGSINIDNIQNISEFGSNGNAIIGKLIANHFEYDESKNEQFQNNKALLSKKIYAFWESIKSPNNVI